MGFEQMVNLLVEEVSKEMEDWFEHRTREHIERVRKYCHRVYEYDPERFAGILERSRIHDRSKFEEPERTPYIHITWQYRMKRLGKPYEPDEDMEEQMRQATDHHVLHNRHHAEFFAGETGISKTDRDKPSRMVDATAMPDLDIAEMVCDWCAVAEERGTDPYDWADKNINKRWHFNKHQISLINDLLDEIWR